MPDGVRRPFASLRGVFSIVTTPFQADGSLDVRSLERLVAATIGAGVHGLTALGVAGEAHRLTDRERERVVEVVARAAGNTPFIVGVSLDGTVPVLEAAKRAERMGATAIMVAPPTFQQPGPALTDHFQQLGDECGLPIILQDYPPVNGVTMTPQSIAELVDAVPAIRSVKLEGVPTPYRIVQTVRLLPPDVTVVGGMGGQYLLEELRAGSTGTMTGFAYPEALLDIWRAWTSGDAAHAQAVYFRWLPLLVLEGQVGIGLAIRKEILRRRGFIDGAYVRKPGPSLDASTTASIDTTLHALDLKKEGLPLAAG